MSTAAAADAVVAEVERVYRDTENNLSGWLTFGANATELGALRQTRPQIDAWKGTLRRFAERGRKDAGSPYTWADWAAHGQQLAESMRYYAGIAADNGPFSALKNAAAAAVVTVQTVGQGAADVVNVGAWGASTKITVGLVAAAIVLLMVRR